jgi:hypothetical protein
MAIIDQLPKISDTVWELSATYKEGMRVPARIIATEKLVREMDEAVSFSLRGHRHHECFLWDEPAQRPLRSCLARPLRREFSQEAFRATCLNNRHAKESRERLHCSNRSRAATPRRQTDGLQSRCVRDWDAARNPCRATIRRLPRGRRSSPRNCAKCFMESATT